MDGTIITTRSGSRFAKDASDWQFAFSQVPEKIQHYHENNYKIVFFTNQAGISSGKTKLTDIKQKIEEVVEKIGVPVQAFVAPTRTIYRKPAPGMWDALVHEVQTVYNNRLQNIYNQSVFRRMMVSKWTMKIHFTWVMQPDAKRIGHRKKIKIILLPTGCLL